MSERHRVLFVAPHPAQHEGPAMRALAHRPDIEMLVAYLSLPDPRLYRGDEFLTKPAFDAAPAGGYPWIAVPNLSPFPRLGGFTGLFNPGLLGLIRRGAWDACVVYGYSYAACWLAIAAARREGTALLLGTDATTLSPQSGGRWKVAPKRRLLPRIFGLADMVIVPSSAGQAFVRSLGVAPDRIALTPYVVDNDHFAAAAAATDRTAVRRRWGVPADAPVALFCAKFIERKRPTDVVRAFAVGPADAHLVMVGTGPLDNAIRAAARAAGVAERVHLPGLVPYREQAETFASCDVLVMSSSHEPWGLPVSEAMACGRPVIASDQVGAAGDLVREGVTGHVYPAGDVEALANLLRSLLTDRARAARMGAAAQQRMLTWSPRDNAEAVAEAVHAAVALRRAS